MKPLPLRDEPHVGHDQGEEFNRDCPQCQATHCPACGEYMPMTLDGSRRVHKCERTPPSDGLPATIYACPICGGHGAHPWGCYGKNGFDSHPHAFMRPVHELVRELREKG